MDAAFSSLQALSLTVQDFILSALLGLEILNKLAHFLSEVRGKIATNLKVWA